MYAAIFYNSARFFIKKVAILQNYLLPLQLIDSFIHIKKIGK